MTQYNMNLYQELENSFAKSIVDCCEITRWIKDDDIIKDNNITKDNDIIESETISSELELYEILFKLSESILSNLVCLDENENREMQNFICEMNIIISDLIGYTIANNIIWKTNIETKFIWITMMTAIKIYSDAIQYLVPLMNSELLIWEDAYGCNCFIIGCTNISSLLELIKYYPNESHKYLTTITSNGYSPIELLAYNGGLEYLIKENAVDIDQVLNYSNVNNQMNILHIRSMQKLINYNYLYETKKITKQHIMKKDINGNIPLLVALTIKNNSAVQELLKSGIHDADLFTTKNASNIGIENYYGLAHVLKYIFSDASYLMSHDYFVEKKIYNYINSNSINEFIKSQLFNEDLLLTKRHNSQNTNSQNIDLQNGIYTVFEILLLNENNTDAILNINENNQLLVISNVVSKIENILLFLYENATMDIFAAMFDRMAKLGILEKQHIDAKNINGNIIDILLKKIEYDNYDENYDENYNENSNQNHVSSYNILASIIKLDKIAVEENIDLIIKCIKYSNILSILKKQKSFNNNVTNILKYLQDHDLLVLEYLFDNDVIKKDHVIGEYDILYKLVTMSETGLSFIIDNELLDQTLLNNFIVNHILNFNKLQYIMTPNIFAKFIKNDNISSKLLNNFDAMSGHSILSSILNFEQLQVLIQTRNDFDHNLFFKKGQQTKSYCNHIIYQDSIIAEYLLKHQLFSRSAYKELLNGDLQILLKNTKNGSLLLTHPFLSKTLFEKKFDRESQIFLHKKCQFDDNIIGYIISHKYDIDVIDHILNCKYMTEEIFNYTNIYDENYIIIACINKRNDAIHSLLKHKYFSCDMLTSKTSYRESVLEIMIKRPQIEIIEKYIKITKKYDLLYMEHNDSTLIYKIMENELDIDRIINICDSIDVDILFVNNNVPPHSTPLHIFMEKYKQDQIIQMINFLNSRNAVKSLNILTDDFNQTPLIILIKKLNSDTLAVIEYLLDNKLLTQDDFTPHIMYLVVQLFPELLNLMNIKNIDVDTLLAISYEMEPIIFSYVSQYSMHSDPEKYNVKLIKHDMLQLLDRNGNTLLHHIFDDNIELFKTLIENGTILDSDIKFITDSIADLDETFLEYLLNDGTLQLFDEKSMIKYLSVCIQKKSNNLNILMSSKYYDHKMLSEIDTQTIINLTTSYNGMKYIFDNKLITYDIISMNNYQIITNINNQYYLEQILFLVDSTTLCQMRFRDGGTILHKIAVYPKLTLKILKMCDSDITELLLAKNSKSEIFLHKSMKYNVDDLKHVTEYCQNLNILYEIFISQNNDGETVLMLYCDKVEKFIIEFFRESFNRELYLTRQSLLMKNNDNTSLFAKICKINANDIVNYCISILTKEDIDEILKPFYKPYYIKNNYITSCETYDIIQTITICNPDNLNILLQNQNIIENYNDFTKCFALACIYQPNSISYLLQTNKVNLCNCYDMIEIEDEDEVKYYMANFMQLACRYNPDSVKKLLCLDIDLTESLYEKNIDNADEPFNALVLAIMFHPDAVKLLIDSKYMSNDYIEQTNILLRRNCLHYALFKQISSAVQMLKSKKFQNYYDDEAEGHIEARFQSLNQKSTWERPNYDNPLYKYKDIYCSTDDSEVCTTCYMNKQSVIFAPCSHKTCISCGVKLYNCHICRREIEHKLLFRETIKTINM